MELTDSIKNKRFESVLDTHLWKTSNEYTALAALKFCYGEKYKDLIKSEAPDFQDLKNSVAIEMTDSVTPTDAQTAGEFTRIGLAKTEEEKLKRRKKIEKNGAKMLMNGMMTWPIRDPKTEQRELLLTFSKKLKKLPEYHKRGFKKIGLLIYHEKPPFDETLQECDKWLTEAQSASDMKYDFVYLFHIEGILFYDFCSGEKTHVVISHEDRYALGNLGRMAAEGEIKDDDPIWD